MIAEIYNTSLSSKNTHIEITQNHPQSESSEIAKKPSTTINMKPMKLKYNKQNEIIKYQFLKALKHTGINGGKPKDLESIKKYINAMYEFEVATNFKDFKKFNSEMAITFKDHLEGKKNKKTGENISKSLYVHYIKFMKEFFEWLALQKDYSYLKKTDILYLNTTQNDRNIVFFAKEPECYSLSEIIDTIRKMPSSTELEMRNKAMISLCLLTIPRISALMTARIQNIKYFKEYEVWAFEQDPKFVKTKFGKYILSFFIGQSKDLIENVIKWKEYLESKGFKGKDCLFPQINSSFTSDGGKVFVLSKDVISSGSWVRKYVFKKAFEENSLKYIHPHNFRKTMTKGMQKQKNGVQLSIALAENMGQKNGMSVLHASYGGNYTAERARLMKSFKLEL